jgi:hypothetical protein
MRPYDEIPFEESDYSDVALLVAGVREFPSEDFARELDARVAQRFASEPAADVQRSGRVRLPRWTAGPAVALVAGAAAAVVVLSSGGGRKLIDLGPASTTAANNGASVQHGTGNQTRYRGTALAPVPAKPPAVPHTALQPSNASGAAGLSGADSTVNTTATFGAAATNAPVAPGSKQIRSAQITLTTSNQHVDQVATEVFNVVGAEHGSVLRSHIVSATNNTGGGYASFSLSIPTSNLQDAMTQLSRLHYAAVSARIDDSQNVSGQYNNDQRQLADAKALRASLLKQLQTAYTTQAIDSIKAQLKLAEQQINSWQATVNSLNHRITYSNLTVEVNAGGLPVPARHQTNSFTLGRALHDALRVLVVAAGVALIALAVALPVGLVVALLMWLWVWLRQRRREHALDATA